MAVKRKFDAEIDDSDAHCVAKQMKLVPFPSSESDMDVAMSEDSLMDMDMGPVGFHSRLPSSASTASSEYSSDTASPYYPTFELYPVSESPRSSPAVQSSTLHFIHQRLDCSQVPKLRVACEAGASGQRTMWSMCEECGAIQMVES